MTGSSVAPTGIARDLGLDGITDYAMTFDQTNPMPMPLSLATKTVGNFHGFMVVSDPRIMGCLSIFFAVPTLEVANIEEIDSDKSEKGPGWNEAIS